VRLLGSWWTIVFRHVSSPGLLEDTDECVEEATLWIVTPFPFWCVSARRATCLLDLRIMQLDSCTGLTMYRVIIMSDNHRLPLPVWFVMLLSVVDSSDHLQARRCLAGSDVHCYQIKEGTCPSHLPSSCRFIISCCFWHLSSPIQDVSSSCYETNLSPHLLACKFNSTGQLENQHSNSVGK